MSFRSIAHSFWIIALTIGVVMVLVAQLSSARSAESAPTTNLTKLDIHTNTPQTLQFTLYTTAPTIEGDGVVTAEGLLGKQTQFGLPDLPFRQTLLALPYGTTAEVSIATGEKHTVTGVDVRPVGRPASTLAPDELPTNTDQFVMAYQPNTAVYSADTNFPGALYQQQPSTYAGVPVLDLALYPLQYNPAQKTLVYYETLEVTVRFVPTLAATSRQNPTAVSSAPDLAGIVLNPEHTAVWTPLSQQTRTANDTSNDVTTLPVGQEVIKIGVTETGIHELTAAELATAGLNLPVPLNQIYMAYEGQPVARQIVDNNNNNQFDSGDSLRFFGWGYETTRLEGAYIRENVFWLWVDESGGGTAVSSAPSVSASTVITQFQSTETFFKDRIFFYTVMTDEDWEQAPNEPDIWYWNNIYKANGTVAHPITLTHPVTT
ncbi:MAG: hypothetical protein KDD89_03670, partial [Anaerolineales bacterium]|nr:hypothetical protein [Anaerolineales bacterium]